MDLVNHYPLSARSRVILFDEISDEIAEATQRKEACAHRARLLEERCRGIRADNPTDPRIWDLSLQIEALDELYDQLSDRIGVRQRELDELEHSHAQRCVGARLNLSEY
jgi:phage replication-related protein YjqB (UPF0714/DUF867 family)